MEKVEGPAFPCNSPDGVESYKGMTLRQWYAGMALQGILSTYALIDDDLEDSSKRVAKAAFQYADSMLAASESSRG